MADKLEITIELSEKKELHNKKFFISDKIPDDEIHLVAGSRTAERLKPLIEIPVSFAMVAKPQPPGHKPYVVGFKTPINLRVEKYKNGGEIVFSEAIFKSLVNNVQTTMGSRCYKSYDFMFTTPPIEKVLDLCGNIGALAPYATPDY